MRVQDDQMNPKRLLKFSGESWTSVPKRPKTTQEPTGMSERTPSHIKTPKRRSDIAKRHSKHIQLTPKRLERTPQNPQRQSNDIYIRFGFQNGCPKTFLDTIPKSVVDFWNKPPRFGPADLDSRNRTPRFGLPDSDCWNRTPRSGLLEPNS